jgi:hypothetical protein
MIRYTLFILTILGTAATAIAAVHPAGMERASNQTNHTVIEKNSPFPVMGPIIVQQCGVEDCSDVQS